MSETLEALKQFVHEQEAKAAKKRKTCYHGEHVRCISISGLGGRCSCKCHPVFDERKMVGPNRDEITNEYIIRYFMFPT